MEPLTFILSPCTRGEPGGSYIRRLSAHRWPPKAFCIHEIVIQYSFVTIVSLLPAATEIAAALGLIDNVVGVSHECDFPEEVNNRPRVTHCPVHNAGLTSKEVDESVRGALHENGTI